MKNKNSYFWLWVLISTAFVLTSCQDNMISPQYENAKVVNGEITKAKTNSANYESQGKINSITKATWVFGEVFHENPMIQGILQSVFTDLKFTFYKDGTYHVVIPAIGRDDVGTWEFFDRSKILFDKGTPGEHHVTILFLNTQKLNYTFNDPALGPWELHLIPM